MHDSPQQSKSAATDKYLHGMDWLGNADELKDFELSNYRRYQFDLIQKYIGANILEVGTGDRSFTNQIVKARTDIGRLVSIEPSPVMMELYKDKYLLPGFVKVVQLDLFDMSPSNWGLFDTIILVHVLEHIEEDRRALSHLHALLAPGGRVLIEVPAMPFLFSGHDRMLGHYRRYNARNFQAIVDRGLYEIRDLWFQDAIGMLGSLLFFKWMRVSLASKRGVRLVQNQGGIYDRFVIPLERAYERVLRLPFGLSLTGILEKK